MDHDPLALTQALPGVDPLAATTFAGRYRILGALGAGGMGTVYRALDTELDEEVALKVLKSGLGDNDVALGRFRREVKLARRVTHVNVARTYDLGTHEGSPFLTMELIDGEPLAKRLTDGPLSLAEALRISAEVARGLTAAHAVDVVHRDLKPENVMLSADRVVITDFGIARSAQTEEDARVTSGIIGTPAYMAPEQVEGRPPDGRTDVYALGVLLFEALTGRLPFEAPTPLGMAAMRLTTEPPDPRSHIPRLPEAIAQLVLDMLARPREERPAAQTVLQRLDGLRGAAAPIDPGVPAFALRRRPVSVAVGELEASDAVEAKLASELGRSLRECVHQEQDAVPAQPNAAADLRLGGSVRVRRERVRVRLQMHDVSDAEIWVGSCDGTLEGELELEDEVMELARRAVHERTVRSATSHASLSLWETSDRLDPEVRLLLERARADSSAVVDPGALDGAVALIEEAFAKAPDHPEVQGMLALALARRSVIADAVRRPDDLVRAEELSIRAIASDPTHPDALQALAMMRYVMGDMRGAARALREALGRAPHLVEANVYLGRLLQESGHDELAAERFALVEALAPNRVEPALVRSRDAAFRGDLAAMDRHSSAIRRQPGGALFALLSRARFVTWWGDIERARECLAEATQMKSSVAANFVVPALAYLVHGTPMDLAGVIRQFDHMASPRMVAFRAQITAETLLLLGDREGAMTQLELGATRPLIDIAWMDRCPLLAPLRADPRFATARAVVAARVDQMWS